MLKSISYFEAKLSSYLCSQRKIAMTKGRADKHRVERLQWRLEPLPYNRMRCIRAPLRERDASTSLSFPSSQLLNVLMSCDAWRQVLESSGHLSHASMVLGSSAEEYPDIEDLQQGNVTEWMLGAAMRS